MYLIFVWLIFAYVAYKIAEEKGLNTALWAVLGVIFGIFTVLVLVCIPSKKYR